MMTGIINYIINFIFSAALFINALLFIPQAIKIYKNKNTSGVSFATFLGFLLIQLAIVLHAVIVNDYLLLAGYILSMITCGTVVALVLYYKINSKNSDAGTISAEEVLAQLPGNIYWKDKQCNFVGGNANNIKCYGFKSLKDYIGKNDYDILPKEQADRLRVFDEEVMRTGKMMVVEEWCKNHDGQNVLYLSSKAPLRNKAGAVVGLVGVSVDITQSKQETLTRLAMLENIIAMVPGHVYWVDADGTYLGCNDNQAKSAGLQSRTDIIGKRNKDLPWNFNTKTLPEELDETNRCVMLNKQSLQLEEPARLDDGTEIIFLSNKAPLYDNEKKVIGMVGISMDITELKNTQKQLTAAMKAAEAANRAKTEFVQNMQHDIRTPCAGLWGVLNILAKSEEDNHKKEALDMAAAASKRLLDLCNDAVEFGDLSSNRRPVIEKALDIRELARSIAELNNPAAFAKNLLIHFKVDASVPAQILCDEFRLSRILVNLMGNAIKFTNKGEVGLSLKAEVDKDTRRGWLTLEIKDTGIGIPTEKIKTIYEKFSRAVASNTNLYPGTGLGLYVVKTFVDELGGEIELESRENEGTSFKLGIPFKVRWEDMKKPGVEIDEYFRSPMDLKTETKPSPKVTIQETSSAEKPFTHELLIIEDDKTCLFAEKNVLSAYTNHIDVAENVAEALEKLAAKRYDLVISDLGLPDGSGNDIVAKIKATSESPNIKTPFVALTAHQDALKHQQAMDVGFAATNTKPLKADKALELLESYPAQASGLSPQEVTISPKVEGQSIIDLALGMRRIATHSEEQVIEGLGVLGETLQVDIPSLQLAVENNDLAAANAILLKIHGGLYYTGTPRLEEACEALHRAVGSGVKDLRKLHSLFSAFYNEAKLFSEQFKELVKG